MTTRRVVLLSALVVALPGLALLGRMEADRAADGQLRQMRTAFAAVGGRINSRSLSAYRAGPPVCLFYEVGGKQFAVMLCFDDRGRLIETSDRRSGSPLYASITATPERATVFVEPAHLDSVVAALAKR